MNPHSNEAKQPSTRKRGGFSLTELVVVASLAAAVFTTGAIAYRTISYHQGRTTTYQSINVGPALTKAFYDIDGGLLDVYTAPNYGITAQAERMRVVIGEDVAKSTGIFCLARGVIPVATDSAVTSKIRNVNYLHPQTIPFVGRGTDLDHPNKFRELLQTVYPDSTSTPFPFLNQDYRGVPGSSSVNGSIYLIQANDVNQTLVVRAIYDIDFLEVNVPSPGIYASVKRYYGSELTHSYDVFYSGADQHLTDFGPIFACFERKIRKAIAETVAIDAFKKAEARPFYMVWWPDPALPQLRGIPASSPATTDPRRYYQQHEQQTAWMFVVPMYPSL